MTSPADPISTETVNYTDLTLQQLRHIFSVGLTVCWSVLLLTAVLSVCLSVRDARVPRLNGSRYRNTYFTPHDKAMVLVS